MKPKRNKSHVFISSDEDDNKAESSTNQITPRSSQRLKKRYEKSSFKLPSRDKIWDAISSEASYKRLDLISPRRTVSNFTKVYNNYNFDDYEDSSEDASEGFVTHSSENSDEDDSSNKRRHKPSRVKNYKRRITLHSSSSSDEDISSTSVKVKEDAILFYSLKSEGSHSIDEQGRKSDSGVEEISTVKTNSNNDSVDYKIDCTVGDDSESDEGISPIKHRRNTFIIESDSSDCHNLDDSYPPKDQSANAKSTSTILNDQPTDEGNIAVTESNITVTTTTSNTTTTSEENNFDEHQIAHDEIANEIAEDCDSSSSKYLTSTSSDESATELTNRSLKFKRKKDKLFQKFKDIQNQKKSSKSKQSKTNPNITD